MKNTVFIPSKYQQDIYDWIATGKGNAIIEAVAGSGKTTTIEHAVAVIKEHNPDAFITFLAFNKAIVNELEERIGVSAVVKTLHSVGFSMLRGVYRNGRRYNARVDSGKSWNIWEQLSKEFEFVKFMKGMSREAAVYANDVRQSVNELSSMIKNTMTNYHDTVAVLGLASHYNIEVVTDTMEVLTRFMELDMEFSEKGSIGFDDMIYLPCLWKLEPVNKSDFLMIDETQDLNESQIMLVQRLVKRNGRVIAVGDRRQSIYGFRGADTVAMDKIQAAFNATVFPLSICYRCPSSHIDLAKTIVPSIEARPHAPKGIVETINDDDIVSNAKDGDLIICRVNAPLIGCALQFIKIGRKAVIVGNKDLGKRLSVIVKSFNAISVEDAISGARLYHVRETEKLFRRNANKSAHDMVDDIVACIITILENCVALGDFDAFIEKVFDDNVNGVRLSSVHRAKGLENDTVFILRPDLLPLPDTKGQMKPWEKEQEMNMKYVALTRSKNKLVFVNAPDKAKNNHRQKIEDDSDDDNGDE